MAISAITAAATYVTEVNAKLATVTSGDVYDHAMAAYRAGDINAMQQSAIMSNRDTVANLHNALVSGWNAGSPEAVLKTLGII